MSQIYGKNSMHKLCGLAVEIWWIVNGKTCRFLSTATVQSTVFHQPVWKYRPFTHTLEHIFCTTLPQPLLAILHLLRRQLYPVSTQPTITTTKKKFKRI